MTDNTKHEQGSALWLESRLGKTTASRVIDIIPNGKGKYYATRDKYLYELLAERLSGVVQPIYLSKPMIHGTTQEPIARAVYEATSGNAVTEVGLYDHPTIKNLAASPDGLIGEDGLIEFKNPETSTHIKLLAGGEIPAKYLFQIQTQLACTGRQWCIFYDFDDRLPLEFQTYQRTIKRDKLTIELIEHESKKFLAELDELETRVRSRKV